MSGKYTVSRRDPFAFNWSKSMHESLAGALSSAWRRHKKDCSVDNVSFEQKVIIDHEALGQAFTEMDNLSREQPKCQPYELAEQIIQKIDEARAQNEITTL
jgi:hypothetical protein